MHVLCIYDFPLPHPRLNLRHLPQRGKVYTVRGEKISKRDGRKFFLLEEIVNPPRRSDGQETGFWSERFRPLSRLTPEHFTQELESV